MRTSTFFGNIAETGNNIVTDGLVFYVDAAYKKSNPKNDIVWNIAPPTVSGSMTLSGSVENDTTYTGYPTASWTFDGTDESIRVPDTTALRMQDEITIICWFKKTTKDGYHHLVSKYPASTNCSWALHTEQTSGHFCFQGSDNGSNPGNYAKVSTNVTDGNWHFGAASYVVADGEVNFHIDTSKTTISYNRGLYPGNVYLSIGERSSVGQYWPGSVAIVQIYNRALSDNEVMQNYNAQKDRFGL